MRCFKGNQPPAHRTVAAATIIDLAGNDWTLNLMHPITEEGWCNTKLVWRGENPRPHKANYWLSYNVKERRWGVRHANWLLQDDPELGPSAVTLIEEQCRVWARDLADQPEPSFEDLL